MEEAVVTAWTGARGGTDVMVLGWNCTEKDDTHSLKQDRKRQTEKQPARR